MCAGDARPGRGDVSGGGEPPGVGGGDGPPGSGRDDGLPGSGGGVPVGGLPRSAAEALAMMDAALDFLNGDFLNGPGGTGLDPAGLAGADLGGVLESLGGLSGKLTAARVAVLARFHAARGHDGDGYGSSAAWLAARGRTTRKAANAEVRRMRQYRAHPLIAAAVARGELSDAWPCRSPTGPAGCRRTGGRRSTGSWSIPRQPAPTWRTWRSWRRRRTRSGGSSRARTVMTVMTVMTGSGSGT